jgi:hypothetical protein
MSKIKQITLDCGIDAELWTNGKYESIEVSLIDLYNGYGDFSSFEKTRGLFKELAEKGYKNEGISTVTGYYDSIDDLILRGSRKI